MKSKLTLSTVFLSIMLAACSGSVVEQNGAIDSLTSDKSGESTSGEPSYARSSLNEPDAAPTSASDASLTPGETDAPDAGPEMPRHGLAFTDRPNESFVADLPIAYQAGGQTQATWEGWFRHDGFPDTALLNGRLFDVGENITCQIVKPSPVSYEAGKVQCDMFGQTAIRSPYKPIGWFHLALTFSSGVFRLFLNGQEAGSAVINEQALKAEPMEGDLVRGGKFFFGATSRDVTSGRTTVDEFRFSSTVRYNGNFAPQKHLDATGADLLLLLDEGVGTTCDSGKVRIRNVAWVTVTR